MKPANLIFIHGMFMTPACWEPWLGFFRAEGLTGEAPAWPGREGTVQELRRRHPDPALGALTLTGVIDHFAEVLRRQPAPAVVIGHSMGGLVAQILVNRGMAAAGVAVDSAPPLGVITTRWSFLRANWPMVNPLIPPGRPHLMTFEQFQYAFVNGMALEAQREAYDRLVVPESRRVPRAGLTPAARVDFRRPHAPLLVIAGGDDHIIPASLNRRNARKYRDPASRVDYREFPSRNHFTIGQPGWEAVAEYAAEWIGGVRDV